MGGPSRAQFGVIVVTVARKPLGEANVALNVLAHESGALNIDASRISTKNHPDGGAYPAESSERHDGAENGRMKRGEHGGRWPPNLILEHKLGCRIIGEDVVKGTGHWPASRGRGSEFCGPIGHTGQQSLEEGHATEVVPIWDCVLGCPIRDLDTQSGECPGMSGGGDQGTNKKKGTEVIPTFNRKPSAPFIRGDRGGASRFFKQVQREK